MTPTVRGVPRVIAWNFNLARYWLGGRTRERSGEMGGRPFISMTPLASAVIIRRVRPTGWL